MSAGTPAGIAFEIQRRRWQACRVAPIDVPDPPLPGQVVFRVDRFALTSNNVTYALTGDVLGYWRFFPADDPWGRIPVMGFADVVASGHPEVRPGERVFGFFPMATHLAIDAGDVDAAHLVDTAPHRQDTALPYRQYVRVGRDPLYERRREDQQALLRGLFVTSFLVDDFLADNGGFGTHVLAISSASSKTAIALAHLASRRGTFRVVGLTSARHRAFVAALGCYHQVLAYEEVAALPPDVPTAFVDHAGDAALVSAIHHHLGDHLRYSGIVGATHWDRRGRTRGLPGAAPAFFFAPAQLEKRTAEWGAGGFAARLGDAWRSFVSFTDEWLEVVRGVGPAAVERAYRQVLEGRSAPQEGHVLSLWDAAGPEGQPNVETVPTLAGRRPAPP